MTEEKQYTREEFVQAIEELSQRTGWTVAASPRWVITNHNTYEMVIDLTVVKRPENNGA